MALRDVIEGSDDGARKHRDRLIAVYIGILAVLLAVCSLGGGNATKNATARNIEAANIWAFFQAKNIRRHEVRLRLEELELMLIEQPAMPVETRKAVQDRIAKYKADEARYTSEPDTGEGTKELQARARVLEAQRDLAMRKDPYFDYGQALLQIAVVLASVSIITGGAMLLVVSATLAAAGVLSMLNGFMLLFTMPLVG